MTAKIIVLDSPTIRTSLKYDFPKDNRYLTIESGEQIYTLLLDEIVICVSAPEGKNFNQMTVREIEIVIQDAVKAKLTV